MCPLASCVLQGRWTVGRVRRELEGVGEGGGRGAHEVAPISFRAIQEGEHPATVHQISVALSFTLLGFPSQTLLPGPNLLLATVFRAHLLEPQPPISREDAGGERKIKCEAVRGLWLAHIPHRFLTGAIFLFPLSEIPRTRPEDRFLQPKLPKRTASKIWPDRFHTVQLGF